ncbi:MAG: SHOCT domain-containing protein [Polyangiaceae bacterium]
MSGLWWLFWVLALIALFAFAVPVPRTRLRVLKDSSPLAVLQRRYAAGELTTEQYEERRAILERDRRTEAVNPPSHPGVPTHRGV